MADVYGTHAAIEGARVANSPTDFFAYATPMIIDDVAQLRALRINPKLLTARALVLALPGISPEAGLSAAARIVSYARECGCSLGAKCMAVSFVIPLVAFAFKYGILSPNFFWRTPVAVLCAFAGAAVGKVFGIGRARRLFNREITGLIAFQYALLASEV